MSDRFTDLDIGSFDLLPPFYQGTDNGEAENFCAALDDEFEVWDRVLDRFTRLPEADRCTLDWLPHLAYRYGLKLPTIASIAAQRRLIGHATTMWRGKGGWQVMKDVIFILTGLTCQIEALWNSPRVFAAGIGPGAGLAMAGPPYRRPLHDSFRAGLGPGAGLMIAGAAAENQEQVYQFRIHLPREPIGAERLLVIWAVQLLRRAQDHPVISWPATTLVWRIGYSRIGIDARVGPGFWRSGMSRSGISTRSGGTPAPLPATHYLTPP